MDVHSGEALLFDGHPSWRSILGSPRARAERHTDQTFFQRLLGYGTADFDTAGSDDSDFSFVGVDDPATIAARVDRAMRGG